MMNNEELPEEQLAGGNDSEVGVISLPAAADLLQLDFRSLKPGQEIIIQPLIGENL